MTIRVQLPTHLRQLAGVGREVEVSLTGKPTIRAVLDALEVRYPALRGTLRKPESGERRDFIRFFACGEDYSLTGLDEPLPEAVLNGQERFLIVGAMAGG